MICIPSRKRAHLIHKSLGAALKTGLPVILFVEQQELEEYHDALDRMEAPLETRVDVLRLDDGGVTFARRSILLQMIAEDVPEFIMCDDDVGLPPTAYRLLSYVRNQPAVAGVGVWFSAYTHFTGIEENTGVYNVSGSMGTRAWAVRTRALKEVDAFSNFMLPTREDVDMQLRLYRAGYAPWCIHSGVAAKSFAGRHAPGGMSTTFGTHEQRETLAYNYFCEEFGSQFFSLTKDGTMRVNWKKALTEWTDFPYDQTNKRRIAR